MGLRIQPWRSGRRALKVGGAKVQLYELLVGVPPFDPDALRRAGYSEMQRLIRESEPTIPSRRLREQDQAATAVALERTSDSRPRLRESDIKGDLDWITLKAMDKDRARRYASASELAFPNRCLASAKTDRTRNMDVRFSFASPELVLYRHACGNL